ncbi:MAG: hypothetical protein SFV81_22755, partial [Pirellulaceae bacterium]|nr:hypothetical protein [Pirellulaceae bacterium]
LSPSTIAENNPVDAVVGTFSSLDPDLGDSFGYSFVAGTGDADNAGFTISGNTLTANSTFDFETKNSYSIRVRTTDAGQLNFERTFTISVTQVNESPIALSLSPTTIAENNLANALVGAFNSTDPNSGDSFTYSLVTGNGDGDNGAFAISGSDLLANAPFNFEAKQNYSIRVRTTDAGGLYFEQEFTINVTNVNESPFNFALPNSTIPENNNIGQVIGTFTISDEDIGDSITYSLVSGSGDTDNGAVTLNGAELTASVAFDFDVKSAYSILVRATDVGGLFVEKNFTITIADVNESPTAISLSAHSLDENNLPGAIIGVFSSTDSDLNETFVYSFVTGTGDTDNSLFTISGAELTTNVAFNFEAKPEYKIRVRSTDSDGLFFEQDFTIHVADVNEAPVVVNPVADFSVIEGTITTDIDLASVFADVDDSILGYSVQVANEELLTTSVSGTVLTITYVAGSLGSSTITVTATDSRNLSISDDFVVTVEGVVPQILVSDPLDGYSGVVGQQRILRFSTSDLAGSEQVFTYEVQWGDGSPVETFTGPATFEASHTFASIGAKTVQVRVIDEDSNVSDWVPKLLNILRTELQGTELAVGGNAVGDTLAFTPGVSAPTGQLSLNGTSLGSFNIPANGVKFFSNGGSDTLTMNGTSGNDTFTTDGSSIVWNGSATWPQPVRLSAVDATKLRVQSLAGNDEIIVSSGTAEVDGGTGTDRITGPNSGGLWNVTGAGLGSLNALNFAGIETVLGGSGDDTFEFANVGGLTGIVDGNGGQDTLSYSARTTAVAISLLANTATSTGGIRNFEQFGGGSATTDTFTAANTANAWQLTGEKSGSLNLTFGFSGFETLKGGTSTDNFVVEPAASSFASVDGGSGTDSLNYSGFESAIQVNLSNRTAPGIASFIGVELLIGSSASDLLIGPNSTNAWTINGLNSGALGTTLFQSFESIQGGTSNDTVTLTATGGLSGAVDGATGVDTLIGPALAGVNVDWTITSMGGGAVNSVNFLGIENLTGGSSLDRFLMSDGGSIAGTINGGSSPTGQRDQLNYANLTTSVSINLAASAFTNVGLISGIEEVVGTPGATDAIRGANVVNAWSITGTDTGTVGSMRFVDIENLTGGILADSFSLGAAGSIRGTIVGGDGTDTVLGPTPGVGSVIDWNVTSAGGGDVLGTDFAEIENLTGGSNLDRFTFSETGLLTGTINGGSSGVGERDQLNYSSTTGPIVVDLAAKLQPRAGLLIGLEEIVGTSSSHDEIRGANAANAWSLSGIDTGTVGSIRFVDIENLTGGTLADSFSLVAGGSIRGTMRGGTGVDTLIGANANNVWQVQGENTGLINAVAYQEIENLTGGSATDTFVMNSSGSVSGVLNAGAGTTDRLDFSVQSSNLVVNLQTRSLPGGGTFTAVEQIAGSFASGDLLIGPNVTASWSLSGMNSGNVGAIQFSGFESVQGGTGNDTFTLGIAGVLTGVVLGGDGTDTLVGPSPGLGSITEWNIHSAGGGILRDVDFEGIENLAGGSNLDRFLFSATGAVTGTINGGASGAGERDQVSYAAVTGPITIDLQAKTQPRVTLLVGIEELVGTDASDELRGLNAANTWNLTGANTGTVGTFRFVGFESLLGGTLTDTFSFVAGGNAVSVDGGAGVDTLLGPNAVTNWELQSSGQGTIGTSSFAAIENLTGGTAVDTFNIGPSGSLAGALNGGTTGRNVLSYATWSSPVTVNLSTRIATAITGLVTNLTIVQGGSSDDQLTGNSTLGTILLGMSGNDALVGVSGRDIMIGGFGSDILTGGNGDDLLIASATVYDNDFVSLSSIFDEWSNTSRNYLTRVNNLRGIGTGPRLNGELFLQNFPTPTLYADPGSLDQLIGGLGQDWFITDDAADITDQVLSGLLAELRDEAYGPPT